MSFIAIKHRRDTAADWTANNPVLLDGQFGIETDTYTDSGGYRYYLIKLGNGVTAWNSLPYMRLAAIGGGGGGASAFIDLSDVPASYTGQGGKYLKVTEVEGGIEFEAIEAADLPTGIDAAKIGDGTVSNTEFQTLNGAEQPFTNALKTKLDGIESGADVTDAGNVGTAINGSTEQTVINNTDRFALFDGVLKWGSWTTIKSTLKTYFDTLYAAIVHTHVISDVIGLQTALDSKVDENAAITGATKTKITYDAKGLVTAGADATTADIADSTDKRYVTDAQLTVIGNTSGTNTGDQNLFSTIAVSGQSNVVADTTGDTLTLAAGSGVTITTDATTDTITIASTGGLTYWTEAYNSATQATSSFTATGAGANINAGLIAKGTGGIVATIPDGTSTGGNARGTYAVDLQRVRSAANQVAAGAYSVIGGGQDNQSLSQWTFIGGGFSNYGTNNGFVICGGYNNTNGGNYAFIGGGTNNNLNSGSNAVLVGGESCYVNSDWTFLGGGYFNEVNANFGHVSGGREGNAYLYGMYAASAGQFSARADAQYSRLVMRRAITGTSAAELFLDGSSTRAILPATNTIWNARVQIAATVSSVGNGTCTAGDTFIGEYVAGIKRLNTTTSLVGTVQSSITAQADANMSTAVVTITADDTNEALKVEFTPPSTAGTTTVIRVVATVQLTQIKY